ncbi:MAG TPA: phosphonate ABC transporter, permease protein PhnE [Fibrobacteria bacterium]|nr:phosphonate ABC transporter, permease protein PhnE [Fibrobacteria bacterium]
MELEALQRRVHPLRPQNLLVSGAFLVVVALCWRQTDMSLSGLVKGSGNMVQYLAGTPSIPDSGFFPPDLSGRMLARYAWSMLETVEMAFLAMVLSVLIAFPLSFLASRNTLEIIFPGRSGFWRAVRGVLYSGTRLFANMTRSINEIIWAMLFVSAVGLGPMPGILALGFHTSGVLIKLFSEGLESISMEPVSALASTGAASPKVIRYAVIPQITPFLVSMVLYRLESDLRSATILGFTGAGGIGMLLFDKLRSYENRDVTTILILIVVTVAAIDRISAFIRSKAS